MENDAYLTIPPYSLDKDSKHASLSEILNTLTRHHYQECPQYRRIVFDSGCFQPVPHATAGVSKAIDLRKNGERPFNLIKKREGLEYARVRGQHNILVQSIFTTVATLLIELAGTRKRLPSTRQRQLELLAAA